VPHTLSAWVASSSMTTMEVGGVVHGHGTYYSAPWRFGIWGHPQGMPMPFVAGAGQCITDEEGWIELATVEIAPVFAWQPLTITFTAPVAIRSLMMGPTCDLDPAFTYGTFPVEPGGVEAGFAPYLLYDRLILNTSDQFTPGITRAGAWCTDDLVLTATLPPDASAGQWYRDGIALVGATDAELDLVAAGLDGGTYTHTCTADGDCFRSDLAVAPRPAFTATPVSGPFPLEVTFICTTADGDAIFWDLGEGTSLEGDTVVHVFTEPGVFSVSVQHGVDDCATTTTVTDAITVIDPGMGLAERAFAPIGIFPNPVQGVVRVTSGQVIGHWQVTDAVGRCVLQGNALSTQLSFDATPLAAGVYQLRVEGGNVLRTGRFIKP
jgi:hypothetical protein